ncbi:MAG: NAD(P)-binding domain-containing protein [Actinomycetota bacterium]|nr:NAD(P)-binding domain-containing protein [Actinomycetota bacterium]
MLLMCLVHLTGDTRWLAEPYLPRRDVRLIADPDAGFSPEIKAEIRDAALALLAGGAPEPTLHDPGPELLGRMMSVCLGEDVPPEYVAMMREDMGFADGDPAWASEPAPAQERRPTVLVVGAGASGIALGAKLLGLGFETTIVEKNDDVGGTWLENRYPGCGVDTPNHFYSYSFVPNHGWRHYFSPREELWAYLDRCADDLGVRDHIRFGHEVTAADWDEAARRWRVTVRTASGTERLEADVVVSAIGHMNRPSIPDIAGIDDFDGPIFHSARWPDGLDLAGKRVAVIGTGASSMQIVPTIAPDVDQLTVFQRSAQWARPIPEYDQEVLPGTQWLLEHVPYYGTWYRYTLFWRYGDGLLRWLQKDPEWPHPERSLNRVNDRHRRELTDHIESVLAERPDLVERCVPTYPPYGKRMLIDNGWFATLLRPNVELVTDPISRITPTGVVTADGTLHEVDVVVLATGFVVTDLTARLGVTGRDGRRLDEAWADDNPSAHLGITVPGFPNLFCMYGPNTNLGHGGSGIFIAECQTRYITGCLLAMAEQGIDALDCRPEAHEAWVRRVDDAHEDMIWTHPGMSTWYRNRHGRVVSTMPFRLVDYWQMTHEPRLDDFEVSR